MVSCLISGILYVDLFSFRRCPCEGTLDSFSDFRWVSAKCLWRSKSTSGNSIISFVAVNSPYLKKDQALNQIQTNKYYLYWKLPSGLMSRFWSLILACWSLASLLVRGMAKAHPTTKKRKIWNKVWSVIIFNRANYLSWICCVIYITKNFMIFVLFTSWRSWSEYFVGTTVAFYILMKDFTFFFSLLYFENILNLLRNTYIIWAC